MEHKEEINHLLEMIFLTSERPLYNELEVGFRHSDLTIKEKLERYHYACAIINQDVKRVIELINA